jgi:hypothetical protein
MLRCEYVKCNFTLSKKGYLGLPPWAWRLWNNFLMVVKPGHRQAVYHLLKSHAHLLN